MQAYQIETSIQENGSLKLQGLPFQSGEHVEVIIIAKPKNAALNEPKAQYSLRGKPVIYHIDPTSPAVSDEEWEVLK